MADWLTRSPEEHIQYDVDVLFGRWPSHPTDMDLAGLKKHLAHHHIQTALTLSTRGALFDDRAGNLETLAATRQTPSSPPPATSHLDQVREAIEISRRPGDPPSSSPSATSPADDDGQADGAGGRGGRSANAGGQGGQSANAGGQGGRLGGAAAGLAAASGSSPSATSQSGEVRVGLGGSGQVGGLPGSSPSATSPADEDRQPGGAGGRDGQSANASGQGGQSANAGGQGGRLGGAAAGLAAASGSSPSATSQSGEVRVGLGGSGQVGGLPGSSPSATSPADEDRQLGGAGGLAGDASGQSDGAAGLAAGETGGSGVRLVPVGTVDLRDAVGAAEQLDLLVGSGVRFLRLFTGVQGVQGETPAYRYVVGEAIARGMVILQDGDPRKFGAVLAGRGADVIFLDLHVYLLADFILMAKEEAGFRATTRMLSSPDGIERVVGSVGARHLVFGSRTPFMDVSPQTLRLRYARISSQDRALIAGGNVRELVK
ncbi:hypothetical protein [Kribbella sp. NPDC051620]|uniref:hypothetical protein n=1 Tax=Kribbella sp. NPDC051620 TaxID=3364120 RepID=UPI0037A3ADE0